jgi:hypothetical protein
VVRLGVLARFGFTTLSFGDSRAYLDAAGELVRTGRYPRLTDPELHIFRPPGYPVFLAAATLGSPDHPARAKIANAAVGAAGAVLLALLSARLFRRRSLAVATGFAAALDPSLAYLCAGVQSEPLFVFLALGSAFLLSAAVDRPSSNLAVASGLLLGAASLTRPSALALSPLLAAPLLDGRYPIRARAHLAASGCLGLFVALLPWTVRNLAVFGEPLPVSDGGALAVYEGNRPLAAAFYDVRTPDDLARWIAASRADLRETAALAAPRPGAPPGAVWRPAARHIVAQRLRDPAAAFHLALDKAGDWLRPYPNPLFWPPRVVWTIGALNSAILVLAVAGFAACRRPGVLAFVLAYLLLTMLVHVATLVSWRYRVACWAPALLLFAASGAFALLGRRHPAPAPGPAATQ